MNVVMNGRRLASINGLTAVSQPDLSSNNRSMTTTRSQTFHTHFGLDSSQVWTSYHQQEQQDLVSYTDHRADHRDDFYGADGLHLSQLTLEENVSLAGRSDLGSSRTLDDSPGAPPQDVDGSFSSTAVMARHQNLYQHHSHHDASSSRTRMHSTPYSTNNLPALDSAGHRDISEFIKRRSVSFESSNYTDVLNTSTSVTESMDTISMEQRLSSGYGESEKSERRSLSSVDVRQADVATPVSRRKRLWNQFKSRTKKWRSRSAEKLRAKSHSISQPNSSYHETSLVRSQPDIWRQSQEFARRYSETAPGQDENDGFWRSDQSSRLDDEQITHSVYSEPVGASSDSAGAVRHRNSEEKESEVDSGIAVVEQSEATVVRQRHSQLRAHPFFQLEVILKEGHDLVVRDSNGTSDPYVKFKIAGKQLYKSRIVYKNLNPKWDERFILPVEDPFKPIQVRVYDYDRGFNDDFMGGAEIDPSTLDPDTPAELRLNLQEKAGRNKADYMGYLLVQCTLSPKTQDDKEQMLYGGKHVRRTMKLGEAAKKLKTQIWSSVMTIVLVEGRDLLPMDDNGLSDPYIKFRVGNEKYKSKYKQKTLNPRWLEQFDLHMFDNQTSILEISVWDHDTGGRDDIMGRSTIDLSELEPEKTHRIEQALEDGAGIVTLLLTISGTTGAETISDLANYTPNPKEREEIVCKHGLFKSFTSMKDIGWLQVKVIKAQNLAAADLGGKSDPFCVMELVNSRLQTQTEYKTLSPEWGKVFTFHVKDIHSVLEVTVYDEDRDKKSEFLGKIAIPLLRVRNSSRKWYQLKDKKLLIRAKGQVMLEMDLVMNHFKAAIRTFNPREEKYMQPDPKFKISIMKRNIDRVTKIAQAGMEGGRFLQSCFEWESKPRSATAFAVFLITVWNFELYMLPITLLIVFMKNLLVSQITGGLGKEAADMEYTEEEDDDDDDDKDKEEKKSFKEKLQTVQEVCLQVQEAMDNVASLGERIKNACNWSVPWLAWLAVVVLSIAVIILYHVPLRYLILAWGINKFTKKLRAPNAIPNNELLDYLSRVPSDKELVMYRELRPDPATASIKKKRS